jgi:hypothetical protein
MAKAEEEALAAGADKVDAAGSKRKSPENDEEEAESSANEADDAEDAKAWQADDDNDQGGDKEMNDDAKEEGRRGRVDDANFTLAPLLPSLVSRIAAKQAEQEEFVAPLRAQDTPCAL